MRGQAEFRVERQGIVMAGLGKLSFTDAQLKENLRAFMIALSNAKPEQVKGQYFRVRTSQLPSTVVLPAAVGLPVPVQTLASAAHSACVQARRPRVIVPVVVMGVAATGNDTAGGALEPC